MKQYWLISLSLFASLAGHAQYSWMHGAEGEKLDLKDNISYMVETQASVSKDKTPLWLNANKYGLSSLEESNGYFRAAVIRPLQSDSARRWGIGYGLDMAAAYNYTSNIVVQQAFVEARWLHGVLTVGSKHYPMELKNNKLSSGSQTLGINARPVPQVRLALPDYWVLPFGNGMIRLKGHIAYGKMTDDNWQHSFTNRQSKYADGVLYHSKAGYIMIGNPDRFMPLSLELGLEMATQFGGTSHMFDAAGKETVVKNNGGLKGMFKALIPGGGDAPEMSTIYQNAEGNHLGSWVARLNYDADTWKFSFYADKYFEDHSSMFLIDYDGYGTGEEWNVKKKRKFILYDLTDWLLGVELNFKYNRWVRDIVVEYINTKYQSGPIYHDHTHNNQVHVGGNDNFYNHYIYTGWQHWGQAMGNPLYRSPIYNEDGRIIFSDNRFKAYHIGISGAPTERLGYRLLATYQDGYGTYEEPFTKKQTNVSVMAEAEYSFSKKWSVSAAYGMDFGKLLGDNAGFQLTIRKCGLLR